MALPVVVSFRRIEAVQKVVGGNPTIQPFCHTGDYLDMGIAVGEEEIGIGADIGTNLVEEKPLFWGIQQPHTGSCKEEYRGVSNSIIWYDAPRVLQKCRQVIGTNLLRIIGKR